MIYLYTLIIHRLISCIIITKRLFLSSFFHNIIYTLCVQFARVWWPYDFNFSKRLKSWKIFLFKERNLEGVFKKILWICSDVCSLNLRRKLTHLDKNMRHSEPKENLFFEIEPKSTCEWINIKFSRFTLFIF